MKRTTKNPWLEIPAEDYEGHMSLSDVGQLHVLNKIFADAINEFNPKSICVLGSATGNGFEHLQSRDINRITGVDINPEYILICEKRYKKFLPQLELICGNLEKMDLSDKSFDLIHAALIFEYVDVDRMIGKISRWLKPNGILSVVLQLSSNKHSPVSESPYKSLKSLEPFINLISPDDVCRKASKCKLNEVKNYNVKLKSGKSFSIIIFKK